MSNMVWQNLTVSLIIINVVNFSSQLEVYHMEKNSSLMLWSIRTWKRKKKKDSTKRKKRYFKTKKLIKWPHKIMSPTLIKVSIHHKNTVNLNIQQIKVKYIKEKALTIGRNFEKSIVLVWDCQILIIKSANKKLIRTSWFKQHSNQAWSDAYKTLNIIIRILHIILSHMEHFENWHCRPWSMSPMKLKKKNAIRDHILRSHDC